MNLTYVFYTFLHELFARCYTFLHELFAQCYTFLHELVILRVGELIATSIKIKDETVIWNV